VDKGIARAEKGVKAGIKDDIRLKELLVRAKAQLPASYFVDISFSCWANRRGRLIW